MIKISLSGLSKLGYYIIDVLHRVPPNVGQIAKDSILYLSVFPLIDGIVSYCLPFIVRFCFITICKSLFIVRLRHYSNDRSSDNRNHTVVIDDLL